MFEKKPGFEMSKGEGEQPKKPSEESKEALSAPPLKPFTRKGTHTPPKAPHSPAMRPEIPRRVIDIPGSTRRTERERDSEAETKKLTVGKDICLSGDITSCDKLLVEGQVEASLSDARIIEVAPSGCFKGNAEVVEADISGRFEGEITVHERLTIRSTGRIVGTVRYGRIVIEDGGEITGALSTLSSPEEEQTAEPQLPIHD